jgi:crotonobetainyl-CoA:carnitine CoA-transferase CaiB-like acyl-CoA transferase
MGNLPLEGYRVIDFGWAAAAPRATCLLADMGAEVIKVETRKRPDPVRFGPDNLARDPEMDPLFHSINRNKLGILLDLTTAEGIDLIKQLVRLSDVVVENFSPGVMKRFTLDYDELKKIKPDIIMISFPGVGREGPMRRCLVHLRFKWAYIIVNAMGKANTSRSHSSRHYSVRCPNPSWRPV